MWPKVFTQLVELLPHLSRLVPMADVFFASKTASEKNTEATLAALTELGRDVRGDLHQVTAAHEGFYRQLQAQGAQIAEVEIDQRRTRSAIEDQLVRIAQLEARIAGQSSWIKIAVALLVLAIALLITLLRSR